MFNFIKNPEYYEGVNQRTLKMVPSDARTILDVGCGAGNLGKELKKLGNRRVIGIESYGEAAKKANLVLDKVHAGDVEKIELRMHANYFNCIIFSGILHHLKNPWAVLEKYRPCLKKDGTVISSMPNIQHVSVIKNLLLGQWAYANEGILDCCHNKFFTLAEMAKMFGNVGFVPVEVQEEIKDKTPENEALLQNLMRLVPTNKNFFKDAFVFQYIIRWKLKQ